MPRLPILLLMAALLFPGAAIAAAPSLRLHAWVDFFPAWVHDQFTRETGIPIVQTFMADNVSLRRELKEKSGMVRYDVITPSSELVQELAGEGLLLPLERERMPNLGDLDPWFASLAYDPGGTHSVPLFWGVLGIVVDLEQTEPETAGRVAGYADLWLPEFKGRLLLPNDFRSLISAMLLKLGYGVNEFERLPEAMRALETLVPHAQLFDTVDQLETMLRKNTAAGLVWARRGYMDGPGAGRFRFVHPREGSPVWIDAVAVPAGSENPEAAFAFIDFIMRPDVLARLGRDSGYAVAGNKARALLPPEMRDDPVLYPPQELRRGFAPELMLPEPSDGLLKQWNRLRDSR